MFIIVMRSCDSLILIAHITYITILLLTTVILYYVSLWVSVFVSHKPNMMSGHEIVWARLERYTYMRWPIMGKFVPGCGWVEDWNYISRSLRKHAMASSYASFKALFLNTRYKYTLHYLVVIRFYRIILFRFSNPHLTYIIHVHIIIYYAFQYLIYT